MENTPTDQLATAIFEALDHCAESGDNLPEMLRAALVCVGRQIAAATGAEASYWPLIEHRPGCWEAEHVAALARELDWPEV